MSKELGELGEKLALRKLKSLGYKILAVNYRCPIGEIDIIAKEKDVIAFIEVRTKSNINFGFPQETVNQKKQAKIRRVAEHFLVCKNYGEVNCRFDVIGVVWKSRQELSLEIIKDAF